MPYLPHTAADVQQMLESIGASSVEDLFRSVPAEVRLQRPLELPPARSEAEILREMERLASKNRRIDDRPTFLGAGVYHRFIPAAVDYLSSRGEFNTSYTPYQPEASQGTLQAIFEYQTMIARLTGMEIANASMYEGATALAEAILMAYSIHGKGRRALISQGVHPEYRQVLETYFRRHPIGLETVPLGPEGRTGPEELRSRLHQPGGKAGDVFAVVIQSPNFFGSIEDGRALGAAVGALPAPVFSPPVPPEGAVRELALPGAVFPPPVPPEGAAARARGDPERPFFIASVEPVSLALLEPPGSYGADAAVGDGQGLGNEPSFGGPSFGFFATRQAHVRKVPGRIVGETRDRDGRRGYVLTFQTREQHIRRERATSNICTNQGLLCLRGAMYLSLLGERGLARVAERSARAAHLAHRRLTALSGVRPVFSAPFFNEFALSLPRPAAEVYRALAQRGIAGGLPLDRYFPERSREMLFACTELTTVSDIARLEEALREILAAPADAPGSAASRQPSAASRPRAVST